LREGHKNIRQILVDDIPRVTATLLTFFTHHEMHAPMGYDKGGKVPVECKHEHIKIAFGV
jgi:hypothetical protein